MTLPARNVLMGLCSTGSLSTQARVLPGTCAALSSPAPLLLSGALRA